MELKLALILHLKVERRKHGHETASAISGLKKYLVATQAIAGYAFNRRKMEKTCLKTEFNSLNISLCCQDGRRDEKINMAAMMSYV